MKKIIFIINLCFFSTSMVWAQNQDIEKIEKQLGIYFKESVQPVIYVDGKKYPNEFFDLIDSDKIKSVVVMKDSVALKKYNAPNGVVWITTKETGTEMEVVKNETIKTEDKKIVIKNEINSLYPLIIIDGTVATPEFLKSVSREDIATIEVIKGESAAAKGYDAPNGVVIIKTKK
ncbi:MAG: hypothetical protein ACFHWX_00005 [Bacteroidota bacterium]